ncbi:hypothetical protein HWD97_22340 [Ochrobactrum sp. C6C9]|uniref:hypothetical protein n=1 Tax=Ochrobactrum sp. C6C9 TaxID=2736662 RepID=UPI00353027F2|nr:hypothetical protein [Ochrobactrum sp. C6C9]
MAVQSEKFLNTVRGKAMVGHASPEEIMKVFDHLDALEMFLDDHDEGDVFGTEGWRHTIGMED